MNIDTAELAKFSERANIWWDAAGEFKTLHDINPLRLNFILEKAGPIAGKKILDIGCGGGILSESLARQGADVIGIDASPEVIAIAQTHAQQVNLPIKYEAITAEAYVEKSLGKFDIVTCLELLEHVPDPASVIQACARLVKPGGDLFLSTINRNPKAYLFAILGAEYLLKMLPQGTHDYSKFLRPSEIATFARMNDIKIQEFKGLNYNPITKKYRLSSDISVNYLVYCKKNDIL